jgi:hypothetical protein
VAHLAQVRKLRPFEDLDYIDQYASRYGLDPDWVYDHTSFGTIMNFAVKWKEEAEYRDRFDEIWREIHATHTK